ncbi:Alpha/Beta hydrolase protein [Xylogone sp. PMI_703]|nr:Alpha/Beta hydrolase protein [Xylogone sp. PMI_703]
MHFMAFSSVLALTTPAFAASVIRSSMTQNQTNFADGFANYMKGFRNPRIESSVGGRATCISGLVDVEASAMNLHLQAKVPANSSDVIELILEIFQINSTAAEQYGGLPTKVSGTYGIYSQLCFPNNAKADTTTIQLLTHGIGADRSYWNIAPDYSYVDYAAEKGYTTFLFDRLGTGLSDHPDPIQIVQLPLQVEILHKLVQLLRTGAITGHASKSVIGVGHSYGSIQTQLVTSKYPDDFDAVVLTGFTTSGTGMPIAFSSQDLAIASEAVPLRFSNLSNGYLVSSLVAGTQALFFREPNFDPAILNLADLTKQTLTVGELLSATPFAIAPEFTGPIDSVSGENDLPGCQGNCLLPHNLIAAVKDELYPAASNSSAWYIAPGTGHGLNFHYTTQKAYEHIHTFLKQNRL